MNPDDNSIIERLQSAVAYDRNGDKIGSVDRVYLNDQTGEPAWVTVNTGFFGLSTSFAPLGGHSFDVEDHLVLPFDKDVVKDAPRMDEDGHLDRAQEDELYRYYNVEGGEVADDALRMRRWDREGGDVLDRDHDGPNTDAGRGAWSDEGQRNDGPLMDSDRDGRGPVEEMLDGPDDPHHPRTN